jgi:protein-arginine kinase activator protein McsA
MDANIEERCFECNRTLAEVAASGELCAGCFFSFDPDEMSAALNAQDAANAEQTGVPR